MFWYVVYAGIFALIPVWLVLKAWHRCQTLNFSRRRDLSLARSALTLLSLALVVLLVLVTLANFGEHLGGTKVVDEFVPTPWKIGVANSLLCASSLVVALRISRGSEDIVRLRRVIVGASIYLMLVWLLVISAAH
jgi:hypothetical protein